MNYDMNYEKKYKEALEKAKKLYGQGTITESLGYVFPELKESEDERIKREILELVSIAGNGNQFEGIKDWLEKQGEHKTTDNVEPKFHPGDWVILNSTVAQILDKQKYGFVGLDIDGKDFFCNYGHTDSMRLWTIADAKDGDVLVTNINTSYEWIGLFKESTGDLFSTHCHYNYYTDKLVTTPARCRNHGCGKYSDIYPATKEQRDLLFAKMKEAGYEWDSEKKDVKKIEHKTLDPDKVIEWLEDQACLGWIEDVEVDKFVDKFKQDFGL